AGVDIDRDHRVGIEVVARARCGVVLRDRIAGAPDGELGRGIVGPRLPQATAAGLPGVVLVLPGLAAGLARLRNRIPAPQLIAGSGIERCEPPTGPAVASAIGDDDFALRHQGGRIHPLLGAELVRLRDLLVPYDLAAVAVDRDDAAIGEIVDDEVFP